MMKNQMTFIVTILLLSAILLACKFNSGTNDSTPKVETTKKTSANKNQAVKNKTETIGKRAQDDSATSEDARDSESDASEATDFRIKRSYYALDENRPKDLLSRDGDYMYFKELESGGTAGYFYSAKPQEAIYALWGGEVIAGPLTTEQQVKEVTAMLSNNMKAEHEMRMSIINNYPTGILGPVRVYDENGNIIREH